MELISQEGMSMNGKTFTGYARVSGTVNEKKWMMAAKTKHVGIRIEVAGQRMY